MRPPPRRRNATMTTLPPSSSDGHRGTEPPDAFHRLNERVRQWVWDQGWTELRNIQERAMAPILDGDCDVILAAGTAEGKTEAAFLPICSRLVEQPAQGVRALYISPLKALINDQFDRLDRLCERLEIPVHRWHGDVSAGDKRAVLTEPAGILLITPESLEAIFVLRGTLVAGVFGSLDVVVIDELHSFIGTERGQQLQSLLSRLELAVRRRIPRIALSATLGDMEIAATFLRPGGALPCRTLASSTHGQEVRLQVRGYRINAPIAAPGSDVDDEDLLGPSAAQAIGEHLFGTLRGTHNLIFSNSRARVETYSDLLRRLSEEASVPNEFWPHHGSLSKELREHAEATVKDPVTPATIICTTTLEMGIDIGSVASVAQLGAPPSVAALRQRLGRSGRRGEPATLRVYVEESALEPDSPPQDRLRAELVQSIAMTRLLLSGWCEPPVPGALHLSTLVQQVLSLIAQHGGCRADEAWHVLCRDGAFPGVNEASFADLLRDLGQNDLVVQSSDGTLLLGVRGERIVNHYSFYTVFQITEEYQVVRGGRTLGRLPITQPIAEGAYLIFAGKRWRVIAVDEARRVVELEPSPAGRPPIFEGGGGAQIHERVRQEMKSIYESKDVQVFLNAEARDLVEEGRREYARYELHHTSLVEYDGGVALFPWAADRVHDTLVVLLRDRELKVESDGIAVVVEEMTTKTLVPHLTALASLGPDDACKLAGTVRNKHSERYHPFLGEALLSADYASSRMDPEGAWNAIVRALSRVK